MFSTSLAFEQRHQRAAAHDPPDLGTELALVVVGQPDLARDQGRGVVVADDALRDVHELLVDDVGRQLLAFQLQELLKEPLVRLLEEL